MFLTEITSLNKVGNVSRRGRKSKGRAGLSPRGLRVTKPGYVRYALTFQLIRTTCGGLPRKFKGSLAHVSLLAVCPPLSSPPPRRPPAGGEGLYYGAACIAKGSLPVAHRSLSLSLGISHRDHMRECHASRMPPLWRMISRCNRERIMLRDLDSNCERNITVSYSVVKRLYGYVRWLCNVLRALIAWSWKQLIFALWMRMEEREWGKEYKCYSVVRIVNRINLCDNFNIIT